MKLLFLAAAAMIFLTASPSFADLGLSLYTTNCTVYPAAGRPSCSGTGEATNDVAGQICVSASYNPNLFSVSISTTKNITPPQWGGPCQLSATDILIKFTVTYIASNCVAGSYSIVFTATQGGSSSSQTFTVSVNCQINAPLP